MNESPATIIYLFNSTTVILCFHVTKFMCCLSARAVAGAGQVAPGAVLGGGGCRKPWLILFTSGVLTGAPRRKYCQYDEQKMSSPTCFLLSLLHFSNMVKSLLSKKGQHQFLDGKGEKFIPCSGCQIL